MKYIVFDFFKVFGKKKLDLDENKPTRFVFHGRKEKKTQKGVQAEGLPSLKKSERKKNKSARRVRGSNGPWKER